MQTVIETRSYLAQAADLGLSEDELKEIADFFANEPDAGELVKGTGGARKARVAGHERVRAAAIVLRPFMRPKTFQFSCSIFSARATRKI